MTLAGVVRSLGHDLEKERLGDVVRAGAGDQVSAGLENLQSAQIDFFVSAVGGRDAVAVLGEGRRIEDDHVEAAVDLVVFLEQVEGVASRKLTFEIAFSS